MQSCQTRWLVQPGGRVEDLAHATANPQSTLIHRFKLYAILDNQQDKTSLSNPIFPVPSILPPKHACITGSFRDLPPAKHHHQILRMLQAEALALLSGAS